MTHIISPLTPAYAPWRGEGAFSADARQYFMTQSDSRVQHADSFGNNFFNLTTEVCGR